MSEKEKTEGQMPNGFWEVTTDATSYLVGKISTLLDAIIADERQVKAAKDMAKTLIWDRKNEMDRAIAHILRL